MKQNRLLLRACFAPLLLLSACSLGPRYQRPGLDIPADWQAISGNGAPATVAWPSRAWWEGFGSPELNALMSDAERNSFDIQAAIARVRQADAAVRVAGAPLLPTVSGNASETWERSGSAQRASSLSGFGLSSGYSESRTYNLGLSVSYELDVWGKLRATQEAAEANALYSRYDQQTVAITALSSVATTWFTALAYQDRLAVAERNLHDAEAILQAIRGREQVGTASMLDVSQQETEVAGLRANIPSFRSELQQEVIALGVLVGHPPEEIRLAPTGTLNTLTLPPVTPGLPAELLARRPDVASAEASLIAARANVRAARAAFFPQISLTGSGGWESLALSSLTGPGTVIASATGSIAQTIFDNGSLAGTYEENKGRYDELAADYRKAVIQAFTDVETALTALRYATEQEEAERQAVATAQRAADIARAQLDAGTIDIVTMLQTETTLFTDLDLLVQVRLVRFQALVNLYKALGGGWSQADVPVPPSTVFHGVL